MTYLRRRERSILKTKLNVRKKGKNRQEEWILCEQKIGHLKGKDVSEFSIQIR